MSMISEDSAIKRLPYGGDDKRLARRRRMEIRRFKVIANTTDGHMDSFRLRSRPAKKKKDSVTELTATVVLSSNTQNQQEEEPSVVVLATTQQSLGEEAETHYPCPSHGVVSICGRRHQMEDAFSIAPSLLSNPNSCHFFAVYDGHGGPQAAMYCKDRMHVALAEETGGVVPRSAAEWEAAMKKSFVKVDYEITTTQSEGLGLELGGNSKKEDSFEISGTTAVVAVVGKTEIVVANCGDSRAVMCRGGKAVALSRDHKADRDDEVARIEGAGGRVICWNGCPRVLGMLAMSRAIGDRYFKPYVIAEPEVTVAERTGDETCLVLASDGLWDVLSNDVVCAIAQHCLDYDAMHGSKNGRCLCSPSAPSCCCRSTTESSAATVAATLLKRAALARGSVDNITVLVIDLRAMPTAKRKR